MGLYYNFLKGYFLLSIPFLFAGCSSLVKETGKVNPRDCEWHVQENEEKESLNKLGLYCLRLYTNGNYALCADLLFEQGKWVFDEQTKMLLLTVNDKDGTDDIRYIADQTLPTGKTQFSFYHKYPVNKAEPDEMIEVKAVANKSDADPYSAAMNSWRKKPVSIESAEQIKKRTIAYLIFLKALYEHEKKNNLDNAEASWYPKPLKFYNNTVRMAYNNEMIDWYNCFYSDDQGIEAYKLISGALRSIKISGDTDVDRNINCVEQLLAFMNK